MTECSKYKKKQKKTDETKKKPHVKYEYECNHVMTECSKYDKTKKKSNEIKKKPHVGILFITN